MDGGDRLSWSCENEISITQSQKGKKILQTTEREKADWIGLILRTNCLLKHAAEGQKWRKDEKEDISTEGKEKITGNLKEEAPVRNLWRNRRTDYTANDNVNRIVLIMGPHCVLCSKKLLWKGVSWFRGLRITWTKRYHNTLVLQKFADNYRPQMWYATLRNANMYLLLHKIILKWYMLCKFISLLPFVETEYLRRPWNYTYTVTVQFRSMLVNWWYTEGRLVARKCIWELQILHV